MLIYTITLYVKIIIQHNQRNRLKSRFKHSHINKMLHPSFVVLIYFSL